MNRSEAGKLGAAITSPRLRDAKRLRVLAYDSNPKRCLHCGGVLSYTQVQWKNRFCCRKCSGKYKTNHRVKTVRCCAYCGVGIVKKGASKYCSRSCMRTAHRKLYVAKLEASGCIPKHPCGIEDRRAARRYLLEKYGNTCSICRNTEWQGKPIPLIADHKDGDSDNNSLSNYRLVCPNCDAQLPTYMGRNRGKGRVWRKERRAAGKNA